MSKSANLLLATLRARLKGSTDKLERQELRRQIRDVSATLARAEYERKAGPVRRELWGAY